MHPQYWAEPHTYTLLDTCISLQCRGMTQLTIHTIAPLVISEVSWFWEFCHVHKQCVWDSRMFFEVSSFQGILNQEFHRNNIFWSFQPLQWSHQLHLLWGFCNYLGCTTVITSTIIEFREQYNHCCWTTRIGKEISLTMWEVQKIQNQGGQWGSCWIRKDVVISIV